MKIQFIVKQINFYFNDTNKYKKKVKNIITKFKEFIIYKLKSLF